MIATAARTAPELHAADLGEATPPDHSPVIAPRPRLAARLDEVIGSSRVSLVQGPAGAGKTALVGWWRGQPAGQSVADDTWWLDAGAGLDADRLLSQMPADLLDQPEESEPRVRRLGLVSQRPAVVVLDDCPSTSTTLADELGRLLHRTRTDVRYVLLGRRPLSLDLHALGVGGEVLPITASELDLDDAGIARVLTRHELDVTDELVRAVRGCTDGWACGVQIAAYALRREPSVSEALRAADRAVANLVWTTALAPLDREVLRLLTTTSVLEEVSPDLAAAVLAAPVDELVDTLTVPSGFVDQDTDGTFRCHPLLRRLLLRRLSRTPETRREATRRAAHRLRERGEAPRVLELAIQAEDWDWVGRELVETLQVPRLLVGGPDQPLGGGHLLSRAADAEPLVRAAMAIQHGWLDLAGAALEESGQHPAGAGPSSLAAQLTSAMVRLADAVQLGQLDDGLQRLAQVDQLMPRLSLPQRAAAPELVPLLQSARGMLELWNGAPDRARRAWESGARGFHPRSAHRCVPAQLAAADCLGQLAFLEAVAGETNRALRHVGDVLAAGPAGRGRTGALFAQLAAVWAQINGGEVEAAADRLDAVVDRSCGNGDGTVPAGISSTVSLVGARLAAITGSGLATGNATLLRGGAAMTGWFADQLVAIRAEAELIAGEPGSALQVLAAADLTGADAHVLRARILVELGDLASAAACLRSRPVDSISALSQVQIELIEARLTVSGDHKHARSLVDRALRAAQREVLRVPIGWAKAWLGPVVVADSLLVQRYGGFLASIRTSSGVAVTATSVPAPRPLLPVSNGLAEPLSARELEVLQRLGSMSTNAEIAAELFLSVNTVKTHLNAVYRKLEVNRRSAAVRRGRELGLC